MALIPPSVTIQEVADLAQVSPKTVSRVINNEPRVRSDTRNRILEAIEQLNYRPNLNARGLASNRSFLIGLFCDRPGRLLERIPNWGSRALPGVQYALDGGAVGRTEPEC